LRLQYDALSSKLFNDTKQSSVIRVSKGRVENEASPRCPGPEFQQLQGITRVNFEKVINQPSFLNSQES
jgi:hypothetical protein